MPSIVRTYQQNFMSKTGDDTWKFVFASIPHKSKPTNRFKVSISSFSAYISTVTSGDVFVPHAFWIKGLGKSISHTATGDTTPSPYAPHQATGDTLLGILGNGYDVNTIGGLTTKIANTAVYNPYYFYLDEMPTTPFEIFYTNLTTWVYSSAVPNIQFIASFLIEEEDV